MLVCGADWTREEMIQILDFVLKLVSNTMIETAVKSEGVRIS